MAYQGNFQNSNRSPYGSMPRHGNEFSDSPFFAPVSPEYPPQYHYQYIQYGSIPTHQFAMPPPPPQDPTVAYWRQYYQEHPWWGDESLDSDYSDSEAEMDPIAHANHSVRPPLHQDNPQNSKKNNFRESEKDTINNIHPSDEAYISPSKIVRMSAAQIARRDSSIALKRETERKSSQQFGSDLTPDDEDYIPPHELVKLTPAQIARRDSSLAIKRSLGKIESTPTADASLVQSKPKAKKPHFVDPVFDNVFADQENTEKAENSENSEKTEKSEGTGENGKGPQPLHAVAASSDSESDGDTLKPKKSFHLIQSFVGDEEEEDSIISPTQSAPLARRKSVQIQQLSDEENET